MFLRRLNLSHFRNYRDAELSLDSRKVIIVGDNAQGKSNLLEGIQFLSTLKSYRTSREQDLVYNQQGNAEIGADIIRHHGDYNLGIRIPVKGKRELWVNGQRLSRHIDFLGIVNTVLFSSLDTDLVRNAPEYRREWLDNLLLQLEPIYTAILREYNQVIKQRNSLLRLWRNRGITNSEMLEMRIWEEKLAENACRVMRRRKRAIERLKPLAQLWHNKLSDEKEKLEIIYQPNVEFEEEEEVEKIRGRIREKLEMKRNTEIQFGATLVGVHRDDIGFFINGKSVRHYGSSGQQRTLVLALKLGEIQLIEQVVGETPLLLLDDVMAELDLQRQNNLLHCLGSRFQTFITTTHLNHFCDSIIQDAQIVKVEQGRLLY
ncbi:MAG: DNA replication/repair protein RecF [Geminocystis sp.]|nr:DNA replication/repair protein RecF [Geminocystis sp.]HIK38619.1 DNA replication/repair protein RecF [Geminocystis sp. M7585_C2015_104]MCS7147683.1 DNA replication/repair protein RecF [Geminocystis sp.]MCX8078474.1 DNA replication/repair protein RecF [Geminocystis sp.]MDW8117238.1 DNA replication/repair protein RecF [Geminocystis sp.]